MSGPEWIRETIELIEDLEAHKAVLEGRICDVKAKMDKLDGLIAIGRELVRVQQEKLDGHKL